MPNLLKILEGNLFLKFLLQFCHCIVCNFMPSTVICFLINFNTVLCVWMYERQSNCKKIWMIWGICRWLWHCHRIVDYSCDTSNSMTKSLTNFFFRYSRTPLIQRMVIQIANCLDWLGPSDKFVETSTKPTFLEITSCRIKYSTVLWLLELQIRGGQKV